MHGHIVANVAEMLQTCLSDGNLTHGDAQAFHQFERVGVSAVSGAESGHGDAHNRLAWHLEHVAGLCAYQKRQRAVQSAADANDHTFGSGVFHSASQSESLDAENLFASFVQQCSLRNEGLCVYGTGQTALFCAEFNNLVNLRFLHVLSAINSGR